MSDNTLNPASKAAAPADHAPYKCPSCGTWATELMVTKQDMMLVVWHNTCKAIISCQILQLPKPQPSSIVVPGRLT